VHAQVATAWPLTKIKSNILIGVTINLQKEEVYKTHFLTFDCNFENMIKLIKLMTRLFRNHFFHLKSADTPKFDANIMQLCHGVLKLKLILKVFKIEN